MSAHVNITIFLVILNAMLMFAPQTSQYAFLNGMDNSFVTTDSYGDYEINSNDELVDDIKSSVDSSNPTIVSGLGFIDTFKLIVDFILWLLAFILAFPTLLFKIPLAFEIRFFLFVPLFLLYMFSTIGWIRTGRGI